jgi:flagellar protein FliS
MSALHTDAMARYGRDAVLSATPAQLLVMLCDRLMLDLGRAEQAQVQQDWAAASAQLLHAQDILMELSASLDVTVWDGADDLLALYQYANTALVNANIYRNVELTREAASLMGPICAAWRQAAQSLPAGQTPAAQPLPGAPAATNPFAASQAASASPFAAWDSSPRAAGGTLGVG